METKEQRNAEHQRALNSYAENVVFLATRIADELEGHNDFVDSVHNDVGAEKLGEPTCDGLLQAAATIIASRSVETLIPNWEPDAECPECGSEEVV